MPDAPGTLIAVVGPSGAGKDSLIGYAGERFADDPAILFVRRVITRPSFAAVEDHDTLSPEAFEAARASGHFAVHWKAHGLCYAIPLSARQHVDGGGLAVINGSRAALPAIRAAFPSVLTVSVTCHPDVLAARLAVRGRESVEQQKQRIARAGMAIEQIADTVEIDNSGDLAAGGDAFVTVIRATLARTRQQDSV